MSSWKTGRSLNTVPFFGYLFWVFTFLGVEKSKAAGLCAHRIGSGVKGEQVQRRAGLPVPVMQLVPKAECESSPLTLKKGRKESSANEVGVSEGGESASLQAYVASVGAGKKGGGWSLKITAQRLADGRCWGSSDSLNPFNLGPDFRITSHRSWIRFNF